MRWLRLFGSFWWWLLPALAVTIYLPFLNIPFYYDDFHSLAWNAPLQSLADWRQIFVNPLVFSSEPDKPMYRPVLLLSYLLNAWLGEGQWQNPVPFRVGNLLLHLANAYGVILLCRAWFSVSWKTAMWAGLLWIVHPVFSEPVFYISSRSDSLCVLLSMGALLCYEKKQFGWFLLLAVGALGSKETAVVLPALLLWRMWILGEGGERYKSFHWAAIASLAIVGCGYCWFSWHQHLLRGVLTRAEIPLLQHFWTQGTALHHYLFTLCLPIFWGIEAPVVASNQLTGPGLAGWMMVPLTGLVAFLWSRRALFLWGAFWLTLAPTVIIPLNVLAADRRLYWPGVFFCLGMVLMWKHLKLRPIVFPALTLVALALLTIGRGRLWKQPEMLWEQTARGAPDSFRALTNLGTQAVQAGHLSKARMAYEQAWPLAANDRDRAIMATNLGGIFFLKSQLDSAMVCYRYALRLDSGQADIWANIGTAWKEMGLQLHPGDDPAPYWQRAEENLRQALARHPHHIQAHLSMAQVLARQGRVAEAQYFYDRLKELKGGQIMVPYQRQEKGP